MKDVIIKKSISISDLIRYAILTIFGIAMFVFSIYNTIYFIKTPHIERTSQVGTVISKSQDEVTIKNGTQTELYLNIQFDKVGFKSIEVEPTTYFGSDVGERVSFGLIKEKTGFQLFKFIWGFLIVAVAIITIIVIFIRWLFQV
jgi:hypothetical protein